MTVWKWATATLVSPTDLTSLGLKVRWWSFEVQVSKVIWWSWGVGAGSEVMMRCWRQKWCMMWWHADSEKFLSRTDLIPQQMKIKSQLVERDLEAEKLRSQLLGLELKSVQAMARIEHTLQSKKKKTLEGIQIVKNRRAQQAAASLSVPKESSREKYDVRHEWDAQGGGRSGSGSGGSGEGGDL